jgi:hypothetical protein
MLEDDIDIRAEKHEREIPMRVCCTTLPMLLYLFALHTGASGARVSQSWYRRRKALHKMSQLLCSDRDLVRSYPDLGRSD